MDDQKLKNAFSKIKEEMSELSREIEKVKKIKNKKIVETKTIIEKPTENNSKKDNTIVIEKLQQKVGILEMGLNSLEKSTIETIKRIREEFDQKLQDEISSIRLELMDVVMKKEQSSTSAFEQELRNTY